MDPTNALPSQPDHLPAAAALAAALAAAAVLSDQLRRRMYGFIRRAHRPVSREEVAHTVGISRKLAAFHLDKLVEVGLLQARYEPVNGIRKVGRTRRFTSPPTPRCTSAFRPENTIY